MEVGRESESLGIDLAVAVEGLPFIEGVYRLSPSAIAVAHPDVLLFGVVLSPWGISELVKTHSAIVSALDGYEAAGRILYVDGARDEPRPMWRAKRISVGPVEREGASVRIKKNRARAASRNDAGSELRRLEAMRATFQALADQATRELEGHVRPTARAAAAPYRTGQPVVVMTSLDGVLEVVADPFPELRLRVLVVDEDAATAEAVRALSRVEVEVADDPWSAVETLTAPDAHFDLAIVALVFPDVPEMSGAKIYRMVRASRPELAARIVLVASGSAVAEHGDRPPSSTQARVVARPVTEESLRPILAPLIHDLGRRSEYPTSDT